MDKLRPGGEPNKGSGQGAAGTTEDTGATDNGGSSGANPF